MKGMLGILALLAIGPSVREYIAAPPPSVEPGNGRGRGTIAGLTRKQRARRAAAKAVTHQKRMLRARGR
jgi:hypothetical protein